MQLTDSHAHLTSPETAAHSEALIARARRVGLTRIVNICTDHSSLEAGLLLAQKYPGTVYNAAATTPHDVDTEGESFFSEVEKAASSLVAIGETGLDFHYLHSKQETQEKFLLRYFDLAMRKKLPIIFHCRDAFARLFELAQAHYRGPALLHCFTGTLQEAKQALDLGWYISLSGIVTFKKSENLRALIPHIPVDRILVETDTPFLAPQSKRGSPNEPAYIVETLATLGHVLNKSLEEIGGITFQNAETFFSFSKLHRVV